MWSSHAGAVGGQAVADTFLRTYFVPGMHHCGGGPGPNQFDMLTVLVLAGLDTMLGGGYFLEEIGWLDALGTRPTIASTTETPSR